MRLRLSKRFSILNHQPAQGFGSSIFEQRWVMVLVVLVVLQNFQCFWILNPCVCFDLPLFCTRPTGSGLSTRRVLKRRLNRHATRMAWPGSCVQSFNTTWNFHGDVFVPFFDFLDVLGDGSRGSRGSSIFHLFYFQSVCMFALGWWFPWFSWFFDFPMFFIFESNVHVSSGMVLLVVRLALGFLRCVG